MKKISSIFAAAALALVCVIGCTTGHSAYEAAEYIPGNTPLVVTSNPEHILSQSDIARQEELLEALEIPSDFLEHLDAYGVDTRENIYAFMISQSSFGAVTLLEDAGKFWKEFSKSCTLSDDDAYYKDGLGLRTFGNVLVALYDKEADRTLIEEYIQDLRNNKGDHAVTENRYFREMVSDPSVVGVWLKPAKARSIIDAFQLKLPHKGKLLSVVERACKREGSAYFNLQSENGSLKFVSAGDYLKEEFVETLGTYSGNHLHYIPETAPMVCGCSLDGNLLSEKLKESAIAMQLNMINAVGVDIWGLLSQIKGDFTICLNELTHGQTDFSGKLDTTVMFDVTDGEKVDFILKNISVALAPMVTDAGNGRYVLLGNPIGGITFGVQDDILYFNLTSHGSYKMEKQKDYFRYNGLSHDSFSFMSVEADNLDESLFRALDSRSKEYVDLLDGMEMNAELHDEVVKIWYKVNFKEEVNPLHLLVDILAENL